MSDRYKIFCLSYNNPERKLSMQTINYLHSNNR